METKEKNFEQDIESWLLSEGGYVKGTMATYDKKRAIDMPVLIHFIEATQSKQWERYKNIYGEQAEQQLYKIFQSNVTQSGLIYVLRNGIKDRGIGLKFVYFEPASGLNEELVEKYKANILTETRQFFYSTENKNSIDMVLSVNGIPIVALELKISSLIRRLKTPDTSICMIVTPRSRYSNSTTAYWLALVWIWKR